MEFLLGCALFGIGAVVLAAIASGVFLDMKDRRDDQKLQTKNWK